MLEASLDAADKPTDSSAVTAIGSRRELFVARLLVGELKNASLKLHALRFMPPVPHQRPHGHYATVLKAEDKFQFYYRGDKDPKVTWKTRRSSGPRPIRQRTTAPCGASSLTTAPTRSSGWAGREKGASLIANQ